MNNLNEVEITCPRQRYFEMIRLQTEGYSFQHIGEKMGVSRQRVHEIINDSIPQPKQIKCPGPMDEEDSVCPNGVVINRKDWLKGGNLQIRCEPCAGARAKYQMRKFYLNKL